MGLLLFTTHFHSMKLGGNISFMLFLQIFVEWVEGTHKEAPASGYDREGSAICEGKQNYFQVFVAIFLYLLW